MRNFIISILCLGSLVVVWTFFDLYSDEKITDYQRELDSNIIKTVEAGEWERASADFEALSEDWHEYKKTAALFLDTQAINEVDYSIAKAKYYIKAKDVSNSSGELSSIKEQLTFLHYNEALVWSNIL